MVSSKKDTNFFDHQYLWKETTSALVFLNRDSNQGKIACKTITAGRVRPGMLIHLQTYLGLTRGEFNLSRDG